MLDEKSRKIIEKVKSDVRENKKIWLKKHDTLLLFLVMFLVVISVFTYLFTENLPVSLCAVLIPGLIVYVVVYNKMMKYVEEKVFVTPVDNFEKGENND